ncbi:MAG: hypothetical protein RJA57_1570 [Bacteroidota bacterium]
MNLPGSVKLVECPRDAMQGWKTLLTTEQKVAYLNALLQVGFDTLDFGSFVSARAIPQLSDTASVIPRLDRSDTHLLAIVANLRGAGEACRWDAIRYIGYPFSVSETFQQRNTNATIAESEVRLAEICEECGRHGKELVVYLSMGFGNPYGDPWSPDIVVERARHLAAMGIGVISLADTVGLATPDQVYAMTVALIQALPNTEIGVHLHSRPDGWREKVDAAWQAGCRRFDGALKGIGGCPMADDRLVGNMNTEWLIAYFRDRGVLPPLNEQALQYCLGLAASLFTEGEPTD